MQFKFNIMWALLLWGLLPTPCECKKIVQYGFHKYSLKDSYIDPAPYIIPTTHPAAVLLDELFTNPYLLDSIDALKKAGFETVAERKKSHIWVMKHAQLPGYLLKLFLKQDGLDPVRQQNLVRRCAIAQVIRNLISEYQITRFTVPEKWLYELKNQKKSRYVLLVQDMNLVTKDQTKKAWKNAITKEHLDELYILLSNGYGSMAIFVNIPYTKEGTFAFIDTEYLKREFDLSRLNEHLSSKMSKYWDTFL